MDRKFCFPPLCNLSEQLYRIDFWKFIKLADIPQFESQKLTFLLISAIHNFQKSILQIVYDDIVVTWCKFQLNQTRTTLIDAFFMK